MTMEVEDPLKRKRQECLRKAKVVGSADLEVKRSNRMLNEDRSCVPVDAKMSLYQVFQMMDLGGRGTRSRRVDVDYGSHWIS
jgi:hypothetical protein